MEEATKGHRLAEHIEEKYDDLFNKLEKIKEELEEVQVSLKFKEIK